MEGSLGRLGIECIDILQLHGVMDGQYAYSRDVLLPALHRLREAGKIRFTGITEHFTTEPTHAMLERAMQDARADAATAQGVAVEVV